MFCKGLAKDSGRRGRSHPAGSHKQQQRMNSMDGAKKARGNGRKGKARKVSERKTAKPLEAWGEEGAKEEGQTILQAGPSDEE